MIESMGGAPKGPTGDKTESKEKIKIEWASETLKSEREKHPMNQDAVLADPAHRLFGIFDGMGGHQAGDIASRLAQKTVHEYIIDNAEKIKSAEDAKEIIKEALAGANESIKRDIQLHPGEREDMGTTASLVMIEPIPGSGEAFMANLGDSRIYKLCNDESFEQLTVDDDLIDDSNYYSPEDKKRMAVKIANTRYLNDLSSAELHFFNKRNTITKAIDGHAEPVQVLRFSIKKGDKLIITSDGIHDNLTTDELKEIVSKPWRLERIAMTLIDQSRTRSRKPKSEEPRAKPDDMSAIVIEIK